MIRSLRCWVLACAWGALIALPLVGVPFVASAEPAPASSAATLSVEQRAWLDQHGPLRVGLVLQAPYAQFDRRLQQLSGANVDLMNSLANTLQVELLWRNFPDQAALEKADRKSVV